MCTCSSLAELRVSTLESSQLIKCKYNINLLSQLLVLGSAGLLQPVEKPSAGVVLELQKEHSACGALGHSDKVRLPWEYYQVLFHVCVCVGGWVGVCGWVGEECVCVIVIKGVCVCVCDSNKGCVCVCVCGWVCVGGWVKSVCVCVCEQE